MWWQIGTMIFDKAFSPSDISHDDETTYAEHALLNQKPLLQPTGNNLETLDIDMNLHVDFCNPDNIILQLKNSKDNFEVLPVLTGAGSYIGDFVITKITRTPTATFPDGTLLECGITISLKEFIINDKLQQQQSAARKQAFAVGDKKPVRSITDQKNTLPQFVTKELSKSISNVSELSAHVSQYENNVSQRQSLSDKIEKKLTRADKSLTTAIEEINNVPNLLTKSNIVSAVNSVRNIITNFHFPITSLADLKNNTRDLQGTIRALQMGDIELTNLVITRGG